MMFLYSRIRFHRFGRSALATTGSELNALAALAITGVSGSPNVGWRGKATTAGAVAAVGGGWYGSGGDMAHLTA